MQLNIIILRVDNNNWCTWQFKDVLEIEKKINLSAVKGETSRIVKNIEKG